MSKSVHILACKRYEDIPPEVAASNSAIVTKCEKCACKIWMVPRNRILKDEYGAMVVCRGCAEALTVEEAKNDHAEVVLMNAKPVVDKLRGE